MSHYPPPPPQQNLQDDQKAELETYIQTRAGLNDLYSATQRTLNTETRRRTQLEQELELLKTARAEKEVSRGLINKLVSSGLNYYLCK